MNWEAIGAVGEILGALAVVATLAYLAQQIRNQNRANEISAFEFVDEFSQFNLTLASDSELHRIFTVGLEAPDDPDDSEAGRFQWLLRSYMNVNHKIYRAYQRGAVEEDLWRRYASEASELLSSPGGRRFLEQYEDHWDYVTALLEYQRDESVVDLSLGRGKSNS